MEQAKSGCLRLTVSLSLARILALFTSTMLPCVIAHAQVGSAPYPSRPVTVIAPYSPGAVTDGEGRLYVQKLSETFGQQFVLDFKAGAGTTIGMGYVARSAPDGYTLMFAASTYPIVPLIYKSLSFDPIKAFAPVSLLSKRSTLFVVHPSLAVKSVAEFVAYAKARPSAINYGTAGLGGIQHLSGAWLNGLANIDTTFVHYKGGGPMQTDLMAGRVHATFLSFLTGMNMVKAGKLRILGVANFERSPALPDMPTVAEQGIPEFEYSSWLGLLAPAQTPAAVVEKLSSELARIVKAPEIVQRLSSEGILIGSTPEAFRRYINVETERWRKLVNETGIKFEE